MTKKMGDIGIITIASSIGITTHATFLPAASGAPCTALKCMKWCREARAFPLTSKVPWTEANGLCVMDRECLIDHALFQGWRTSETGQLHPCLGAATCKSMICHLPSNGERQ